MMRRLLLCAALVATARASCPGACSGHGSCGSGDMCSCEPRWLGADCSQRECPYGLSWTMAGDGIVPAGSGLGGSHKYAECSSKGLCDRTTGECVCFPGYDGRGCRRQACPSDCSGHGRCLFAGEMVESYTSDLAARYSSQYWDAAKTRQCACDRGWEGFDCSQRMCPKGDDPLTDCDSAESNGLSVTGAAHPMVQRVVVQLKPTEAQEIVKLTLGAGAAGTGIADAVAGAMCGAPVVQFECSNPYTTGPPDVCGGVESVTAQGVLVCGEDADYSTALAATTTVFVDVTSGTFSDTATDDQVRVGEYPGADMTALTSNEGGSLILFDGEITAVANAQTGCHANLLAATNGYPAQFQGGLCDISAADAGSNNDQSDLRATTSGRADDSTAGPGESSLPQSYWGYVSLKYTDMFGGEYFTRPILIDATTSATQFAPEDVPSSPTSNVPVPKSTVPGSAGTAFQWETTKGTTVPSTNLIGSKLTDAAEVGKRTNTLQYTADRIRAALQDLPNFAIPMVNVTNAFLTHPNLDQIVECTDHEYAATGGSGSFDATCAGPQPDGFTGKAMYGNVFDVTFTDAATSGAQPLLECYFSTKRSAAGAFPRMNNQKATTTYVDDCWVEEVDPGTKSYQETVECSNRGACDHATGMCSCFEGYTGEACATQTIFF